MSLKTEFKCPACNSNLNINLIWGNISKSKELYFYCTKGHSVHINLENFDLENLILKEYQNKEQFFHDNEDSYWALVSEINWSNNFKNENYLNTAKNIVKSKENKKDLEQVYSKLYKNLMDTFDKFIEDNNKDYPLGDDSTSDFIAHICGEGKEEYYMYLNDPKKMYLRAKREGYISESFDYIWNTY